MPAQVFISYRRADEAFIAQILAKELRQVFGENGVFLDTGDIKLGVPFPVQLRDAVGASTIVVVVIGARWRGVMDSGKVRILEKDDWVRKEVALALRLQKTIIPVLVGDTQVPSAQDLPADLHGIVGQQTFRIRTDSNAHSAAASFAKEAREIYRKLKPLHLRFRPLIAVGIAMLFFAFGWGSGLLIRLLTGSDLLGFLPAVPLWILGFYLAFRQFKFQK